MNSDGWVLVATWFLYFAFYALCGFFLEIIHAATHRSVLENRGFLFGPYCPIYGVGALVLIATTQHFSVNPIMVFLMSMLFCTIIEYFTAVILEKIFRMKWWDYSKVEYNFQGRICLRNSILFGVGGLAIIYITQPSVENIIGGWSDGFTLALAGGTAAIMGIDFILSVIANYNIKDIVGNAIDVSAQQIKSTAISFYLHPKKIRRRIRAIRLKNKVLGRGRKK